MPGYALCFDRRGGDDHEHLQDVVYVLPSLDDAVALAQSMLRNVKFKGELADSCRITQANKLVTLRMVLRESRD